MVVKIRESGWFKEDLLSVGRALELSCGIRVSRVSMSIFDSEIDMQHWKKCATKLSTTIVHVLSMSQASPVSH